MSESSQGLRPEVRLEALRRPGLKPLELDAPKARLEALKAWLKTPEAWLEISEAWLEILKACLEALCGLAGGP